MAAGLEVADISAATGNNIIKYTTLISGVSSTAS